MKKIAACLLCSLVLLTSCRGVPLGIVKTVDFPIDEETLSAIGDDLSKADRSEYYLEKYPVDTAIYYNLELYVQQDEVIFHEDDQRGDRLIESCYTDGILYRYENEEIVQTAMPFDTSDYDEDADFAYRLLTDVFECEPDQFELEIAAYSPLDDEKLVSTTVYFSGKSDNFAELREERPNVDYSDLTLMLNYPLDTQDYSYFMIAWSEGEWHYSIIFDAGECPESLSTLAGLVEDGVYWDPYGEYEE